MGEEYQQLKARAIKTIYTLLERCESQIDPNDVLALGEFFGVLSKRDAKEREKRDNRTMKDITLTDEQFQQLLEILDSAKNDARGGVQEYATSMKEEDDVEEYCKGIDAVIALLEQSTKNNQPPTPPTSEGE